MRGQENIYIAYFYLSAHFKLLFYSAACPRVVTCIYPPLAKPVLLIFDHMLVGHFLPDNSTYITNAGSIQRIVASKKNKNKKMLHSYAKLQPLIPSPIILNVILMPSVTGKWHMLLFFSPPSYKRRTPHKKNIHTCIKY